MRERFEIRNTVYLLRGHVFWKHCNWKLNYNSCSKCDLYVEKSASKFNYKLNLEPSENSSLFYHLPMNVNNCNHHAYRFCVCCDRFGCCPDGITAAAGDGGVGCFECEGSAECDTCNSTKYGCCPDGVRAASGPEFSGCEDFAG
jgi:hypothetical protein